MICDTIKFPIWHRLFLICNHYQFHKVITHKNIDDLISCGDVAENAPRDFSNGFLIMNRKLEDFFDQGSFREKHGVDSSVTES